MIQMLSVIIVAAGKGSRMGCVKKQFLPFQGMPLFLHSVNAFIKAGAEEIWIAVPKEDLTLAKEWLIKYQMPEFCRVVSGGESRQESVKIAFSHCHIDSGLIAIHDAARPFIRAEEIQSVCRAAKASGAAILGTPVSDTVKQVENGAITKTIPREQIYLAQTPQIFRKSLYQTAIADAHADYTDDAQLFESMGIPVQMVAGSSHNRKLTTPEDLQFLEDQSKKREPKERQLRIGHGYDVHRLVTDRPLILCGVQIPYEKGLLGHSDADVAAHALMDALLGAAAFGDIGQWFPDTDVQWKDANSLAMLKMVIKQIASLGYSVQNLDLTILAQQPKLSPYLPEMRKNLSSCLGISQCQTNIKATTEEGLGFTGQKEGIAAHCVLLLDCQ